MKEMRETDETTTAGLRESCMNEILVFMFTSLFQFAQIDHGALESTQGATAID